MRREHAPLLANEALKGRAWCKAHSELVDAWLARLLEDAAGSTGAGGLALVAVGGYGRSELCPNSDIDVMLVHDKRSDFAQIAERIWYPIWDEGLHLGHSVATVKEAVKLTADDLDTATALLSARHVAGDEDITKRLADLSLQGWQKRSRDWLVKLAARVETRLEKVGEVAFRLEPDLKEGRGGLRDVHSLWWAEAARRSLLPYDTEKLWEAYGVILDARVELHRLTGRPSNVLAVQEQAAVATALGDAGPDMLMDRIAEAARTIAWTSDDSWRRIRSGLRGPGGRSVRARQIAPGILLRDEEIELEQGADVGADPLLSLSVAAEAAKRGTVIERKSLERLVAEAPVLPDPWPAGARSLLVELLLSGAPAIGVIEALDQRGVWTKILPEWGPVRARQQHNIYHLFTIDRHLLETAANASVLADRVTRPDLLVVGALLHDIGKGYEGDHSEVGMRLVADMAPRMGWPASDVATLVALVEHHLLLPDVATRRDLDDPATIAFVAERVGTTQLLDLLLALTEADSLATGPSAWGPWKKKLVTELARRTKQFLEGEEQEPRALEQFPTEGQLRRLSQSQQVIEGHQDLLTVMIEDRPGVFCQVAGVLALHGLDVVAAAAYSSEDGKALAEFRVSDPIRSEIPWQKVIASLELALDGRLALRARVAERARAYGRKKPMIRQPIAATVGFDNRTSDQATIVDVHAPDRIGVLYRIAHALVEMNLDIRSAKVQTIGANVVDSFYVRNRQGEKITEPTALSEIEKAILHNISD
ncbi:MAG: [protein-PII] uridylyltransferase [Actinomycetota bacterium]|nr:[protein-PII] uridylyltransferase [Actinomycetota bacterium]